MELNLRSSNYLYIVYKKNWKYAICLFTEKATSELNVSEDWQAFMDICDRIKASTNGYVSMFFIAVHLPQHFNNVINKWS